MVGIPRGESLTNRISGDNKDCFKFYLVLHNININYQKKYFPSIALAVNDFLFLYAPDLSKYTSWYVLHPSTFFSHYTLFEGVLG